jgi:hypothetical protein
LSKTWLLVVPPLPRRDADLVALGVGQHPEGWSLSVGDQHAAGVERGLDPAACLVMWDGDVEMDSVALWARLGHLLEPDRGALRDRVDERVLGTGCGGLVGAPHHCLPEGTDPGDVERIDRDLHDLNRSRVPTIEVGLGPMPKLPHGRGDPVGELDVARDHGGAGQRLQAEHHT